MSLNGLFIEEFVFFRSIKGGKYDKDDYKNNLKFFELRCKI